MVAVPFNPPALLRSHGVPKSISAHMSPAISCVSSSAGWCTATKTAEGDVPQVSADDDLYVACVLDALERSLMNSMN
jgi:hypothetical protein